MFEIRIDGMAKEHTVRKFLSIKDCEMETGIKRSALTKAGPLGFKTVEGTYMRLDKP